MVVEPWRALVHAALWNGQAPQVATGAARTSESHCQLRNCQAGTIAIAITGTVSSATHTRRSRSSSTWSRGACSGTFCGSVAV